MCTETKRKYEFTGEEKKLSNGITVKRIRRLSDGLLGGWIESEDNLSHYGSCFVYNEAVVCRGSRVIHDAKVFNNAYITKYCKLQNNAIVRHNVVVRNFSTINKDADMGGLGIIDSTNISNTIANHFYYLNQSYINVAHSSFKIFILDGVNLDSCRFENTTSSVITLEDYESLKNGIYTFDLKDHNYITMKFGDTRSVTYYKPKQGGQIKANIGCQRNLTLDGFKHRIFNTCGGIDINPHRVEYLKQIECIEILLNNLNENRFEELKEKYSNKEE